jgi:hypothetical protein
MKATLLLLSLLAAVYLAGCGEEPGTAGTPGDTSPGEVTDAVPDADLYFTVVDSIGVELGDSNYVFGAISSARFAPDGSIFVVDTQRSTVLFYTPGGEYIRQVGRSGSGPGELTMPSDADFFEDGRFVVTNNGAMMLTVFDRDFDYLYDVRDFFPAPPMAITAVEGNRVVGVKPDWMQNEEGMFMGFTVACWDDSGHVTATYHSSMSPFDPSDLSSMLNDLCMFGASRSGRVFTASMSSEEYAVTAWSPEAEELFVIGRDLPRVHKTQDEIDRETELANARMIQNGMPPEMAHWEPDPYRNMVGGIQVDDLDRVWVRRGTVRTPYYDVYDLDGTQLFTAAVDPSVGFDENVGIVVGDGSFLAFNPNPEDYARIYVLELEGVPSHSETGGLPE